MRTVLYHGIPVAVGYEETKVLPASTSGVQQKGPNSPPIKPYQFVAYAQEFFWGIFCLITSVRYVSFVNKASLVFVTPAVGLRLLRISRNVRAKPEVKRNKGIPIRHANFFGNA